MLLKALHKKNGLSCDKRKRRGCIHGRKKFSSIACCVHCTYQHQSKTFHIVFKNFHFGEWIQIFAVDRFTGYVWTEGRNFPRSLAVCTAHTNINLKPFSTERRKVRSAASKHFVCSLFSAIKGNLEPNQ